MPPIPPPPDPFGNDVGLHPPPVKGAPTSSPWLLNLSNIFVFKGSWTLRIFLRSSGSKTTLQAWNRSFPSSLFSPPFLTNNPWQLLSTFCVALYFWVLNDPLLVHQRKQNLCLLLLPPLEILGCRNLSTRMTTFRRGEGSWTVSITEVQIQSFQDGVSTLWLWERWKYAVTREWIVVVFKICMLPSPLVFFPLKRGAQFPSALAWAVLVTGL